MLQNVGIQLNVARQFNVLQSAISRLWNRHQQSGNVTDLPVVGVYFPLHTQISVSQ